MNNTSKCMFLLLLLFGTIFSISSNSLFMMWMGLEINLLAFIPMMNNLFNMNNSEATLNYFLTQALASIMFLLSIMFNMILINLDFNLSFMIMNMISWMIASSMMLKLGAAPFHSWFPNISESITWTNNLILFTWQKIAPLIIISYLNSINIMKLFLILSIFIGAMGGLNQTSLRKMMSFSSINHIGWMIASMMINMNLWMMYFLVYSFLNMSIILIMKIYKIYYMNQINLMFMNSYMLKLYLFSSILSLAGLPPFLGFLPKWLIIDSLINYKFNFISFTMIMMSLVMLIFYLKMCINSLMINMNEMNWNWKKWFNNKSMMMMSMMNMISIMSFFFIMFSMFNI